MKCLKCGRENLETDKFCLGCGEPLNNGNIEMPKENNEISPNIPETLVNNPSEVSEVVEQPSTTNVEMPKANIETSTIDNLIQNSQVDINNQSVENTPSVNNTGGLPVKNNSVQFNKINDTINNLLKKYNLDKKKLMIILGIIIAIIIVIIVIRNIFGNDDVVISNIFNEDNYIAIEKDDKYGFINKKGKVVIEPTYEYAYDFYGDYAYVVYKENEESVYAVINKKGSVVYSSQYTTGIVYVPDYNVWVINDKLYNSKMKQLSSDDIEVSYVSDKYFLWENNTTKKTGIMNYNGKILFTIDNDASSSYVDIDVAYKYKNDTEDNYCIVKIGSEKYGIVNCDTGKVVYDYTNNYIDAENDNIFTIETKGDYDFVSTIFIDDDKIAYQSNNEDEDISYYTNGYLQIYDDTKDYGKRYSYYNISDKSTSTSAPSTSNSSEEILEGYNLILYKSDGKYGLKSLDGKKEILSCEWSEINALYPLVYNYLNSKGKNYIFAVKDSKTYLIDLASGKHITEFNTSYISTSYSTSIYYTDKSTNKKVIYNLITGKSLEVDCYLIALNTNNVVVYDEDYNKTYYNTNLELIYTEKE